MRKHESESYLLDSFDLSPRGHMPNGLKYDKAMKAQEDKTQACSVKINDSTNDHENNQ